MNRAPAMDGAQGKLETLLATAYTLLLQEPGLSLDDFAQRLGLSEQQTRTVLDQLTDMALLQRRQSEYGNMIAVSPLVAMQRLISREQVLLRQRQQYLGQSYSTISAILASYASGGTEASDEVAEQVSDLPSVRRRIEELALTAKEEVLSFTPAAGNPTATREASRQLNLAALGRGVQMRTLYHDSLVFEPAALEFGYELEAAGAEVRLVPETPMRLIIVDRETAVVPRDLRDSKAGALIVRHPSIVQALIALFEVYWPQGRRLPGSEPDALTTSAERAVIRLLAAGAKDDAVARQLGTSVRTVRRIIAELMVRAQAESRFALGVYAKANQWL